MLGMLKKQRSAMTSVVKRLMVGGQIGLHGVDVAVISTLAGQGQEALQDLAQAPNPPAVEAFVLETLQRQKDVCALMEGGQIGMLGVNAVATLTLGLGQRMPLEPAQALPPAAAGNTALEKHQ